METENYLIGNNHNVFKENMYAYISFFVLVLVWNSSCFFPRSSSLLAQFAALVVAKGGGGNRRRRPNDFFLPPIHGIPKNYAKRFLGTLPPFHFPKVIQAQSLSNISYFSSFSLARETRVSDGIHQFKKVYFFHFFRFSKKTINATNFSDEG